MADERRFDPVALRTVDELSAYLASLRTVILCPDEETARLARIAVATASPVPGLYEVRVGQNMPAGQIFLLREGLGYA